MDDISQATMPGDIAPHANELRATEIAGSECCPATSGSCCLHANLAQLPYPVPVEQRPVLIV